MINNSQDTVSSSVTLFFFHKGAACACNNESVINSNIKLALFLDVIDFLRCMIIIQVAE